MTLLIKLKFLFLFFLLVFVGEASAQIKSGELLNIQNISNPLKSTNVDSYENPQWSPDGTKIAFTKVGFEGLYVMDANGSAIKKLTDAADAGYGFQWSANSDEILYRDARWTDEGRHRAIWSVDMDGKTEKLSEDDPYLRPGAWKYSQNGNMRVQAVDVKMKPILKTRTIKANSPAFVKMKAKPSFNKSFFVDAVGDNFQIVDENGNKTRLGDSNIFCPVFSPNGEMIAYNQEGTVCVMDLNGNNKVELAEGFYPTWASDNQLIFERTEDDGHVYTAGDLYMINIDGSGEKQITKSEFIERFPVVSPDGKKILFINEKDGQIYSSDLK